MEDIEGRIIFSIIMLIMFAGRGVLPAFLLSEKKYREDFKKRFGMKGYKDNLTLTYFFIFFPLVITLIMWSL